MDDTNHNGRYWWKNPPSRLASSSMLANEVTGYAKYLEEQHRTRYWRERVYEALYTNDYQTGSGYGRAAMSLIRTSGFTASRLNVTRSIVNTFTAKLGGRQAAIKANPSDVDYSMKQRARRFTKFIRGEMEGEDVNEVRPMVVRDACIVGTAAAKVYPEWGEIKVERVLREELFVDERDARFGKPRQMFQRKVVAKEVLIEKYPGSKSQILLAPPPENRHELVLDTNSGDGTVEVWEGWHLPSGPDAKDGRHIIAIDTGVLLWEEWTRPRFPFAFLRYESPRRGFWGHGMVEHLAEMQAKVNDTVRDIQDALYFGSQLKIFVRRGANVNKTSLGRTQRSSRVEYDGAVAPQYHAPNPVSKDALAFLQYLIGQMYELEGISQMAAQAKNPMGANASGVALDNFYDLESERYKDKEQAIARWSVDLAECMIDVAQQLATDDKQPEVKRKWHQRNVRDRIDWSDVGNERDQYRLTLEANNFLPDTRAGKLQASEQLAKMGILKGPQVSALLGGFPDLDRINRLNNSAREAIEQKMEWLKDPDIELAKAMPDGFDDLDLYDEHSRAELAIAVTEDAPEEVAQRFRDAVMAVVNLQNKAQEAVPPPDPMAEMGGVPPGPGGMAPDVPGMLPPGEAPMALPGEALPNGGAI